MIDKIRLVVIRHTNMPPSIYASIPNTEFDVGVIDLVALEGSKMSNADIDAILFDATNLLYPVY